MKKIYYNKLIRDKIPKQIQDRGFTCETQELTQEEFEKELIKKLNEEIQELKEVNNKARLSSELADIVEAVEEIKKVNRISDQEIEDIKQENYKKKGGFDKKLFLTWSSDEDYKNNKN